MIIYYRRLCPRDTSLGVFLSWVELSCFDDHVEFLIQPEQITNWHPFRLVKQFCFKNLLFLKINILYVS